MKKGLERAIEACIELLQEFDIDPNEWILVGPHADILNDYPLLYDRPTHFHVLIERKKIPWKISKEQKDLIDVSAPLNSSFQKRCEQYMAETGYDFDIILAPKPIKSYEDEIARQTLSKQGFFQRMKPLGNLEISEYTFSKFSPDKLRRKDVIQYIEILVDEARKRNNIKLIKCSEEFVENISKRQREYNEIENNIHTDFIKEGLIKGVRSFPGKIKGIIQVIKNVEVTPRSKITGIVVMLRVSPKVLPAIAHAKAWIVDEGGVLSHAAIVARELKKPCIIGTKIATKVLKDGDMVEVDAENGVVRILK